MSEPDLTHAVWIKSSRSGNGDDANCVEVADLGSTVAVRDSKQRLGPVLLFDRSEWRQFVMRVGIDDPFQSK